MIARFDLPIQRAAFSMDSGGTPVISATLRRSHCLADSATASKPVVYCVDEFAILQPITQDDVQHSHQECKIGSRAVVEDRDRRSA